MPEGGLLLLSPERAEGRVHVVCVQLMARVAEGESKLAAQRSTHEAEMAATEQRIVAMVKDKVTLDEVVAQLSCEVRGSVPKTITRG